MSVDVLLTQKSLIKKTLPLNIILGDELKYGLFDGLRLTPDEMSDNGFVAYNPDHISRGFSVTWNEQEKEKVVLRASTPSHPEEIKDFFALIERICNYWKCELQIDGEIREI